MLKSLYLHFYSEHLYGHHKYVSTPNDPATAKFGQTLYEFIPQTIKGGFMNAWKRECKATKKLGKSPYSLNNNFIQWLSMEAIFTFSIWCIWGWKTLGLFLFQAFFSIFMLETINYIRHYGLQRKKQANRLYEPVTTKHSWNAPQTLQNFMLIKVQRHSDHHANSYKPYQTLLSCEDSPNLPCGYTVCVLASFFPPVWFRIINPLAEATNKQGQPNEEQMKKSNDALKIWLAIQTSIISILALII
ncbi:hypothetical protein SteCoe_21595 [Stentor coeruleus]|uniref:Fatty acid desaturase domain-containing protein n=1 Tax=Stentor coeruleus TaxID=5963 RepID=A0A1R2BP92_9CILI|nr:hypothetical protein SteCoe_21595 [Stentor coeruleus]